MMSLSILIHSRIRIIVGLVLLVALFKHANSFVVVSATQTRGYHRPSWMPAPLAVTAADAQLEDLERYQMNPWLLRKQQQEDADESGWIRTQDGNYLPNLSGRGGSNKSRSSLVANERVDTADDTVLEIEGLEDYKREVVDVKDRMVCVRFYATWCRACKAIGPAFHRLPSQFPEIKFVEVPITPKTQLLHRGLGITSLPFAHLYHPNVGLVEERKIGRKNFKQFQEILHSYVNGFCLVDENEDEQI